MTNKQFKQIKFINKNGIERVFDSVNHAAFSLDLKQQNISKHIQSTKDHGHIRRGTYRYCQFFYLINKED